jgi:exopolyphosphatase/guanosine-5'-triphosphate,3'-diphosphate pyrophosphatase
MRLAAIDLGTVTSRLLIADVDQEGIHEIARSMRITHLGEGLNESGLISSAAIEREVAACTDFLATIAATDGGPVECIDAVATSAMRDASNSKDVLFALHEAGLEVSVIPGKREAQLSFLGTLSGFANLSTPIVTVDVGGGSTEVILGALQGTPRTPQIYQGHSSNTGSRRVTDRFLHADPPTSEELRQAQAWIRDEMQAYFASFQIQPTAMIAVAGTATTAVTVRDAMVDYDPWKVHGAVVTAQQLERVLGGLATSDLEQRRHTIGLESGRASVIVGGLITLQTTLELAGLTEFIVSETDILHGILLDAYSQ